MNTIELTEEKIKTIQAAAQAAVPLYTLSLEVCQQDPLQDGAIRAEMVAYLREVSDPRVMLALLDDYARINKRFRLLKLRSEMSNDNLYNIVRLHDRLLNQFEEADIARRQTQVQPTEDIPNA